MSDLQLSLLGMGALLVVGVWGYNKLQERKYRRAAEQVFPGTQPDVLAPREDADELPAWARNATADRIEPVVEPVAEPVAEPLSALETHYEAALPVEPSVAPDIEEAPFQPMEAEESLAIPPTTEPPSLAPSVPPLASPPSVSVVGEAPPADWCSDSIDAVGRIHFDTAVSADDLQQAQGAMQRQQRVLVRGFVRDADGVWHALEAANSAYKTAWFAIQLVDRNGVVDAQALNVFAQSLTALASLRDGQLLFPDIANLSEQAKALDDFCAQLDLQLALNVLDSGNGTFAGTKIRGLAEAAGMQLEANGEYHARDEAGNFMFALANMGEAFDAQTLRNVQTHGLTFFLDVPHVVDGGRAFEYMLSTARQFATALNGSLVNAQRMAVSGPMVDSIRTRIYEIQEQMTLAGIPSGGVRALRLFS